MTRLPPSPQDDSSPVIEVRDLWASFRLFEDRAITIRDRLTGGRTKATEHWALRGIDLEVHAGEAVAIVGANGSGKSTFLKLLARIFPPTHGSVEVRGRVAPMLELGAGFHGDLSGRDNVYLNAAILGFGAEQVDAVFDDIVAFAELSEFMDRPVRTYSSGMYLRLGFSVAVHLEPDVLLVDEVLAVGDASFGTRCLNRIREMREKGITIVLVSHDLATVGSLCDSAVYLDRGELRMVGPCSEVLSLYRSDVDKKLASQPSLSGVESVFGTGEIEVESAEIRDESGSLLTDIGHGADVEVVIHAKVNEAVVDPVVGILIRSADGAEVYNTNSLWRQEQTGKFGPGARLTARYRFPMRLLPGVYSLTASWANSDATQVYHWRSDAATFQVVGTPPATGVVDLEPSFSLEAPATKSVQRRSIEAGDVVPTTGVSG